MPLLRLSDSGCASSGGSKSIVIGTPAASAGATSRRSAALRAVADGLRKHAHAAGTNGATTNGTMTGCSQAASAALTAYSASARRPGPVPFT